MFLFFWSDKSAGFWYPKFEMLFQIFNLSSLWVPHFTEEEYRMISLVVNAQFPKCANEPNQYALFCKVLWSWKLINDNINFANMPTPDILGDFEQC